jgi:hypothetical protein
MRDLSSVVGGGKVGVGVTLIRASYIYIYVALTKNNLRKIDPDLLKEYSHLLLVLSQSFALVLDVFEKRLELVVVHAANLEHRLQF